MVLLLIFWRILEFCRTPLEMLICNSLGRSFHLVLQRRPRIGFCGSPCSVPRRICHRLCSCLNANSPVLTERIPPLLWVTAMFYSKGLISNPGLFQKPSHGKMGVLTIWSWSCRLPAEFIVTAVQYYPAPFRSVWYSCSRSLSGKHNIWLISGEKGVPDLTWWLCSICVWLVIVLISRCPGTSYFIWLIHLLILQYLMIASYVRGVGEAEMNKNWPVSKALELPCGAVLSVNNRSGMEASVLRKERGCQGEGGIRTRAAWWSFRQRQGHRLWQDRYTSSKAVSWKQHGKGPRGTQNGLHDQLKETSHSGLGWCKMGCTSV